MPVRLNMAARNCLADAITNMTYGSVKIYTGTQPAGGADATATGTLLCTFSDVQFGTVSSGQASVTDLPKKVTVAATGTAGWGRYDGVPIDGTAGLLSTHNFTLSEVDLVVGMSVSLLSAQLSMPGE
jgi:hypothetical protein